MRVSEGSVCHGPGGTRTNCADSHSFSPRRLTERLSRFALNEFSRGRRGRRRPTRVRLGRCSLIIRTGRLVEDGRRSVALVRLGLLGLTVSRITCCSASFGACAYGMARLTGLFNMSSRLVCGRIAGAVSELVHGMVAVGSGGLSAVNGCP